VHGTGAHRHRVSAVLGYLRDPPFLAHATVPDGYRAVPTRTVPGYASPHSARVGSPPTEPRPKWSPPVATSPSESAGDEIRHLNSASSIMSLWGFEPVLLPIEGRSSRSPGSRSIQHIQPAM